MSRFACAGKILMRRELLIWIFLLFSIRGFCLQVIFAEDRNA
uniref:Uncharacterized protein n=1 Tax=Manihot esculenta TaxID=3983 RepID=A0A2C9VWZ9_MANES